MPAYKGASPPPHAEVLELRDLGREALALLDAMLAAEGNFLGGEEPSIADLFIAVDLFALDADPERSAWFEPFTTLRGWLDRLRSRDGYQLSHDRWNAVAVRVRSLLEAPVTSPRKPDWVAEVCLGLESRPRPSVLIGHEHRS